MSLRLPLTVRRTAGTWTAQPSSGGLVAALGPLADRLETQWIGWAGDPGDRDDPSRQAVLESWRRDHGFVPVDLEPAVARGFYDGYSNATLWPLLHGFPGRIEFDSRTWAAYRAANEQFAEAVLDCHRPGDLIWIHDYQLALLPELVRARVPDARIGFFLHVPFPASELFRILPDRAAVLRGLLGADLLGFQTHTDVHDFRRTVLEVLGRRSRLDRVELDDRAVTLSALPVGIESDAWARRLADRRIASRIRKRRATAGRPRTILAVDRLDYTKGLPERLRAYRELLRRRPGWRGEVQLLQVAVPSRERVPRYAELRREVSELIGDINGELGTADWTPVAYLRRTIPEEELTALYATADVAWVSPLRDGMNLVAKEYVACQADGDGVLVLSEFAGAAQELGEALRVNPYDIDGSVATLEQALTMPVDERRTRQAALLARVRRNDAHAWSERFLASLRAAADARDAGSAAAQRAAPTRAIRTAAAAAASRAFYLDYDGTLAPIAARPADAAPSAAVLGLLRRLASDPRNRTVLLSGRPTEDLDAWFAGIAGLWLVGEHGALIREPAAGAWQPLHPSASDSWKPHVRELLEHMTDRAPGSFIEDKRYGLAWHYRLADPEFGPFVARELISVLDQQLGGTDLVVLAGRKVVEVRHSWANKGEAAMAIRGPADPPAFELAIGDDRTDEDLFERLPDGAWTIHVGRGPSGARYRLADPAAVIALLGGVADDRSLADEEPGHRQVRRGARARVDRQRVGGRVDRVPEAP